MFAVLPSHSLRNSKRCCHGNTNYLLTLNLQHVFLLQCLPSCCSLCFSLMAPHSPILPVSAAQIDPSPSFNLQNSTQPVKAGEFRHRHTAKSAWKVGKRDLETGSASTPNAPPWEQGAWSSPQVGHSSLGPGQGSACTKADDWLIHPDPSHFFRAGSSWCRAENSPLLYCVTVLGGGALCRFLKSNYAYYWLGFQKPSMFAECINLQPFPSLMFPDSPILQVEKYADGEQWRKAVTRNQRRKRNSKMERELPDDIISACRVPRPSPWRFQLC